MSLRQSASLRDDYCPIPTGTPTLSNVSSPLKINKREFSLYEKIQLDNALNSIETLRNWEQNWDGYDSKKPNTESIENTRMFVEILFSAVKKHNMEWFAPYVSANEEGDIVLEWWKGDKKVTAYVSHKTVYYIKSLSPVIDEMEDGILNFPTINDCAVLWQWLTF